MSDASGNYWMSVIFLRLFDNIIEYLYHSLSLHQSFKDCVTILYGVLILIVGNSFGLFL